jgi:dimethylhistidine N-methyltransferase
MTNREFATDVRAGLCREGQKQLPPNYFYDDLGTALFEAITLLPEYGLTRADVRIITHHAMELAALFPRIDRLVELGSGTGSKTKPILAAYGEPPLYVPIDVSKTALDRCRGELEGFRVEGVEATYIDGLRTAVSARAGHEPLLLLFLGSTIGNFDRDSVDPFMREVRDCLRCGDGFLLGTDLIKDVDRTLLAYDDPVGVTAAFNRNVLARINRELRGTFDLRRFRHLALWNAEQRRIEMHLQSMREQMVTIAALGENISFENGETIWTESSHKFELAEICELGRRAGFGCSARWTDNEWPFAETLFVAK